MPVQAIERIFDASDPPEEIGIRIIGAGRQTLSDGRVGMEILYADIPGQSWNPQRLDKFRERAQELIDFRIPLTDAELVDDPDALTDPARPDFFHDAGDLVARSVIISDVTFTDRLNFTLTRAR